MPNWIKSEKLVDLNYDDVQTDIITLGIKRWMYKAQDRQESQGRLRSNSTDRNAIEEE